MFFVMTTAFEVCCYFLVLLPFLAVWFLLPAHKELSHRFRWGIFFFSVYLCGIAAVTGLPTLSYGFQFDPTVTLIPFHHFIGDMTQYLLNILLFLPAGFLLPLLWPRYKDLKETAGFGFCLSLLIEISQLFCFRTTDLNDLLMNTLGAALGWLGWKLLCKGAASETASKKEAASPWSFVAIVWVSALLLQGYLSSFLWPFFFS